jgi:hypothetical protein
MPVVLLRGGGSPSADVDDEKARRADALQLQLRKMLADEAFVSQLPNGVKDRLEAELSQLSFQLAIYRGELLKLQLQRRRRQSGGMPLALAGTTTFPPTGTPADLFLAIAAFAVLTIAIVVTTTSPVIVLVGRKLEAAIKNIQTTSEGVASVMTPVPLDFSPSLSAELFQQWISSGLLVQSGATLALNIDKIKKRIDDVFGAINRIPALNRPRCEDEIAAVVALLNKLSGLVKDLEQGALNGLPTGAIVRQVIQTLKDIDEALEALNQCLMGGTPPAINQIKRIRNC